MKVYIDMDGVLANMEQGYLNALNKVFNSDWGSLPEDFFLHLPKMLDADHLIDTIFSLSKIHNLEVAILTAVPRYRHFQRAAGDKFTWIRRYYPQITEFLIGPYAVDKQLHCRSETDILIDDSFLNIPQWIDAGGIGILHTSAEQSIKELKEAIQEYTLDSKV